MASHGFNDYEIGPSGRMKRIRGLLGFAMLIALAGGAFSYLFFLLTLSWQIALGSVTVLIGFMLLSGWWAERSGNSSSNQMR